MSLIDVGPLTTIAPGGHVGCNRFPFRRVRGVTTLAGTKGVKNGHG
jgi:hypothetical protein